MMNTHTRRERETGPTFVGASLKGWGLPLQEVPHAHPDLVELLFEAAVVPFFFLFLLFFLDFGEGVVAPAAQPVFLVADFLNVVGVEFVFFLKLCDALLNASISV